MRFILTNVCLWFLFGLASCGSKSIQISMSGSAPYPDSSSDFSMYAFVGKDTINFGSSRIYFRTFSYIGAHSDTLGARIWFPGGRKVDSTNIVLLIPGFRAQSVELYPLAIETTKRGFITIMICARGTDLNASDSEDYGAYLIRDSKAAINTYQQTHGLPNLKVAVFGCSLGSVAALNLSTNDDRIVATALESMMPDLSAMSKKMLSGSEEKRLQELLMRDGMQLEDYNPSAVVQRLSKQKKLLVIWGEDDKLISSDERNQLRSLIESAVPKSEFEIVSGAGHVLRYGFPLSEQQAVNLNIKIASFLQHSF